MPADELNDSQLIALDLLTAGATQQQATDAAGVTRQTVNEWCTKTPLFIGERQTRRMLRTQHHADRVQSLADKAFDVFKDLLDEGDQKAATFIVRMAAADGFVAATQPESAPLRNDVGDVLRERLRKLEQTEPDPIDVTAQFRAKLDTLESDLLSSR